MNFKDFEKEIKVSDLLNFVILVFLAGMFSETVHIIGEREQSFFAFGVFIGALFTLLMMGFVFSVRDRIILKNRW